MSVYEYVLQQQQPQPSSLSDLEVHECNEALLSNGMRVMEQNFSFFFSIPQSAEDRKKSYHS